MEILKTKNQMQTWSKNKKKKDQSICFVPTMGYLHKGHTSLLDKGKPLCDELVLSIFVNPTQFGPNEDLDSYPSDLENDLALAEKAGATAVFLPNKEAMYPKNFQTRISLDHLPNHLCGKFRPVHFGGVATVVTKLFHIVMPDIAIFGQKDYQQLQIIRQLVSDLDFDIQILAGDIVREADGLAMSSRNAYLTKPQRESAVCLNRALKMAQNLVSDGQTETNRLKEKLIDYILGFAETAVEYADFCNPVTLEDVDIVKEETLLALAVKVGTTRLIDNTLINP